MSIDLYQALRLSPPPSLRDASPKSAPLSPPIFSKNGGRKGGWEGVAFVGAGGKTTALFQLAYQIAPAVVTTTTHLGDWQAQEADRHIILGEEPFSEIGPDLGSGVTLVTGPAQGDRLTGLDKSNLNWLRAACHLRGLPLLIEADGSRERPLKAPAAYEPVIPEFAGTVVVVAGLSGLGKPLTDEFVHRPEIFARLSGLNASEIITPAALSRLLAHPAGGLKGIPAGARRIALLNQADTPELQAQGKMMAEELLKSYAAVVIASLEEEAIHAVHEPASGIVLAAGESSRFGSPKQLLDWHGKPFVRQVAEAALAAGLSPVIVVTGANAEEIDAAIQGMPITILHNPEWKSGQSSSIRTGLNGLPNEAGSATFLLADQPQVSLPLLRALVERHSLDLSPVVAPQVKGQRANPVLFDRATFPGLMALSGDVGGRAVFSKYPVTYLPWHDEALLADIDTPEDYRKLLHGE